MPTLELGFSVAATLAALLVLLAWGAAWLTYRATLPPVPTWKRLLLTGLRGTALGLTLLLLCEPLARLVVTSTRPPTLAVLLDNSQSMGIRDRQEDRGEKLASLLRSPDIRNAAKSGALLAGTFGVRTGKYAPSLPASLPLQEEATDIASALRQLADQKEEHNIRAALLVTDGVYTLGQNPLHEAEQLGLPLFTVGIGDSSEQKDVLITKVVTNNLVYGNTEVPVDVTVKSSGYSEKRVEVTLLQGARELARTALIVGEGTREYPLRLTYVPDGEGMQKFTVRVSGLEGELTSENNRKNFFARVLKSKLRVLILAGGPNPDLSVLRQTLLETRHLEVESFTQRTDQGFYEGAFRPSALDSADCLLTIGFPTATTSEQILQLVLTAATAGRKPWFYIDGKGVDEARLLRFSTALPFAASGFSALEQYVFLSPAAAQAIHPILAPGTSGRDAWDNLPPIFRRPAVFRPRPEAQVLGTVRTQNAVTAEPLLLIRSVNHQKSLAVLGYGLWRWRLMAQGNVATEQWLSGFLMTAIRWLTTREDDRPVKTATTRDQYTQGEPVEFIGQVYDAGAAPVDNAQLVVTVEQRGKELSTALRPIGNGRYQGTLDGLAPGEYTYRAVGSIDGQPVAEDRGAFSVGELDLEFVDTRMNAALLRQLAARTGGRFYRPEELSGLSSTLSALPSFTAREVRDVTTLELWNWRVMLGVIVFLFGFEWLIRKRSGML